MSPETLPEWVDLKPVSRPLLVGPQLVASRNALPKAHGLAVEAWQRAETDHRSGRYPAAAAGFLRSAELFASKPGEPNHAVFLENRRVAYVNAARCFAAAEDVAAGKKALQDALKKDAPGAAAIKAALAELGPG